MRLIFFIISLALSGCTILHSAQIGEIDLRQSARPFEVLFSETGVDVKEAARAVSVIGDKKSSKAADDLAGFIALFQMGPRTGKPIYSRNYVRKIRSKVLQACPSGKITGLSSVRETASYPVVSGEIVKITGYCITGKKRRKRSA